jgi:cytochrome c oxidase assembly factor CtaG
MPVSAMNATAVFGKWISASPLLAHVGGPVAGPRTWAELARAWEWEPLLVFALLVTAWLYRRGVRRLWAEAGRGRGLRRWEVAAFWAGWWTLVVALVSPLHPWGRVLFAAHMTQHELLMVAAAPLLVLGRPLVAFLFTVPKGDARQISRVARVPWVKRVWDVLTKPLVAWALHAVALWVWHVPQFFEATLTNAFVHDLQHVSFFGTALLFWWALIHGGAGVRGFGMAALYLFTTMVHTGLLGALLTFADGMIYPAYASGGPAWGLTPREDQQLGGLIMWVPAGLVYVGAALALIAGWMRAAERRFPAASKEVLGSGF